MTNFLRKIAPVGFGVLVLACTAATSVTPASAAVNSRDCKISGICNPASMEQFRSFSNMAGGYGKPLAVAAQQGNWNSRDCRRYGICPGSSAEALQ